MNVEKEQWYQTGYRSGEEKGYHDGKIVGIILGAFSLAIMLFVVFGICILVSKP